MGQSWIPSTRIFLILLAALAAASAFVTSNRGAHRHAARPLSSSDGKRDHMPPDKGSSALPEFSCPMHPNVRTPTPGDCPICGMTLTNVSTSNDDGDVSVTIPAEIGNRLRYDIIVARLHMFVGALRAPARGEAQGTIVARLYNDEVATLAPGEHGWWVASSAPEQETAVHASTDPPIPWDRSSADVRFVRDDVSGTQPRDLADGVGWVKLAPRARQVLVAPEEALVESPTLGPCLVAVTADNRTYTLRPVRVGKVIDGLVTIVSGVEDQQRILGRDVFFLDAERRLRGPGTTQPSPGEER
jgi:hypothetical protein